jgi:hypothetical protein
LRVLGFEGLEISELLVRDLLDWSSSHGIDAAGILQGEELRE